jgi:Carboxypeptidase regulatory-like domain/TonB-dependent Receptor Plug Domain
MLQEPSATARWQQDDVMTLFARTLAALSTALLLSAPAAAQVLRGTVVDHHGKPVDGAHVTAVTPSGTAVGDTVTGTDGGFAFHVPAIGGYILRATRVGYAAVATQPINVASGMDASVQLRLNASPVTLDTVTVVAESVAVEQQRPYLAEVGFYARKHHGLGRFLTRADLEKTRSDRLTDALRGMPGVHIVCGNGQYCDVQGPAATTTFTRGVCEQTVVLDGVVLRTGGISGAGDPVDQLLNPFNLDGVEVYSSPAGVPVQFKGYMSPCGAIIAWSRR